ncbi:CDP-diacylglycerol--serine O-phosphatidyltransferase [Kineococcus xinjiangensis]|uniref:CDP-diacylglycerol--serine O-phosphatidyltransferase n=1 Tax=Kineococcus xinjiangensis TaxID=512762 RepID=A0A2S6IUB9_9ACTN|nr:CDP-diacylglycerol--serine O-phosphatidyltransferase [Kineococcus xinjiangensis]PPK97761.1 CDP-diacylglycerol--serine O-phosphatidyltransferase [Kineococcus xinjiangensis]
MSSSRDCVTLANAITSANLVAGFLGLLAVLNGDFAVAALLVAIGALCDLVDGPVARRGRQDEGFGATLDSLADLLSFGVVPAMALYAGALHELPVVGLAAAVGFLLAGAWRLARFPLVKQSTCFVGLPIPVAGLLMMLSVLSHAQAPLVLGTALAAGALMISTVPFPNLAGSWRGAVAILHAADPRRR